MKARRFLHLALLLALVLSVAPPLLSDVAATPTPNSAVIKTRIWNDCPLSTVTTVNTYPTLISISDANPICPGYANLHNWRFSTDGVNAAVFNNDSNFRFGADLTIAGTGEGEAGLQISPWWSKDVDGRLNVRTTDGEIACFGGRLPFYSFSAPPHSLRYTKGTTIHVEIVYLANDLTSTHPATIEYIVTVGGTVYTSGVLPFDQGNPAEDPPYGLWGMLNDGRVGGHFQYFLSAVPPPTNLTATFANITFENLDPVPVALDIKPGSCDNPIGFKSKGVLPVAILGSADLDVSMIDPATLRLAGVAAKRWSIEDVMASTSACDGCVLVPPDGYPDLVLKFVTQDVIAAITPVDADLEMIPVKLTGAFLDGRGLVGTDCVVLRPMIGDESPTEGHVPEFSAGGAASAPTRTLTFTLPEERPVRIAVYTITGRLVEELMNRVEPAGTHTITWDASRHSSGVYFHRFEAGSFTKTEKVMVVH